MRPAWLGEPGACRRSRAIRWRHLELLHDRHRIRRWRIGREPGLRALTRDAMMRFYRNFYHPGNTVLSIVGDVDPDDALRMVEAKYGALPSGEPHRAAH